jgi:nucleotide-binding universal stress UspA family protein
MTVKSIATVVTETPETERHLECAAQLAQIFDAHLEVFCGGLDYSAPDIAYPETLPSVMDLSLETAAQDAKELKTATDSLLANRSFGWESSAFLASRNGLAEIVAHSTQYADLTVLGRPYGDNKNVAHETIAEAALFSGPGPVLFCENPDTIAMRDKPIVLGWNETPQALAAIRASLPFLKMSSVAHIVMVAPPRHSLDRSDPGGRLARALHRHGVNVDMSVLAQTLPRASDELMRFSSDRKAGMIVMGAYGHSRLR